MQDNKITKGKITGILNFGIYYKYTFHDFYLYKETSAKFLKEDKFFD